MANALSTVIGAWDAPQEPFEKARALLESAEGVRAGVTLVNSVMVVRLLGEATAVRAATIHFLAAFRGQRLPRVWHV
jgi:urease accessory protein